jgi:hypothetical protein
MRAAAIVSVASLLVALAAGCAGSRTRVTSVTVERTNQAAAATGNQRLYGQLKSLRRSGRHYELRLDPAWFLSGVTANVAQAEDRGSRCRPSACPPVANDNYVVDESHRVLTYIVPTSVRGTVLTKHGSNGGPFPTTSITVRQLKQLMAGESSLKLFEPLSTGVWIVVQGDTVRSFAQQYKP